MISQNRKYDKFKANYREIILTKCQISQQETYSDRFLTALSISLSKPQNVQDYDMNWIQIFIYLQLSYFDKQLANKVRTYMEY